MLIALPECRLLMLSWMKVFLSLLASLSSESLPSLSLESTVETERDRRMEKGDKREEKVADLIDSSQESKAQGI